jgi:hypothetical protein
MLMGVAAFTRAKTFERWITGNKDELFAVRC